MKQITLSILLLLPTICFSQKQKKQIMVSEDSIINKWQKAVIDIESESDKLNIYQILQFISSRKQQNKSYSLIDSLKDYDSLRSLINRTSGTAIYLADGKNRYLITAKHVVFDRNFTIRHKYFTQENLSKRSDEYFEKFNANVTIETPLSLFLKGKYNSFELPEINQDSVTRPFKFSDNNLDIAILSLQNQKTYLIQKVLEEDGYSPIDIKNIDTIDNNKIGDNLIAIGYPSYSLLGNVTINGHILNEKVVLPLITFGRTALNDSYLNYFVADITINPGNSGGPVLKNNKLVGIVSQQILVDVNTDLDEYKDVVSHIQSRSVLAYVIKTKYIIDILNKLKIIENGPNFLLQKYIP